MITHSKHILSAVSHVVLALAADSLTTYTSSLGPAAVCLQSYRSLAVISEDLHKPWSRPALKNWGAKRLLQGNERARSTLFSSEISKNMKGFWKETCLNVLSPRLLENNLMQGQNIVYRVLRPGVEIQAGQPPALYVSHRC